MKVKFGSIVVDGRGKLGGQVYARNRSGAYARNKVTPNNPQTQYQSAVRSRLAQFSTAWRALTQTQRDAWNAAVEQFEGTNVFGDLVKPNGKNLFSRLNINLDNIGESAIDLPPVPADTTPFSFDQFAADPMDAIQVAGSGDANMHYLFETTGSISPGIGFFKNKFKLLQSEVGASTMSVDLTAKFEERFGEAISGQKIAVKVTPVNSATGQKGTGVIETAIVA